MTFLTSLFAENRDSLGPSKTKQKIWAVTASALLLVVGGTAMVQNNEVQPSRDVSSAVSADFARVVSATSIATVAQPSNVQYRTTIDLNMRTGPGTQYSIINYGPHGTTVTGTGKTSGIWYQVKMGSQTGWMSSDYLQKIAVQTAPASNTSTGSGIQYKTTIQLNLRAGAGTQYKVLGYGVAGTTVSGTGKTSGIWYEVKMGSLIGWMSSEYLQDSTGPNTVSALQSYAGSKLNNPAQLKCLITLWNRESNWNYRAINSAYNPGKPSTPDYQAYGIAQAAPGNKMATSGADWLTNPRTQINWGLDYIKGRYGTPCKALDHSYAVGWY